MFFCSSCRCADVGLVRLRLREPGQSYRPVQAIEAIILCCLLLAALYNGRLLVMVAASHERRTLTSLTPSSQLCDGIAILRKQSSYRMNASLTTILQNDS